MYWFRQTFEYLDISLSCNPLYEHVETFRIYISDGLSFIELCHGFCIKPNDLDTNTFDINVRNHCKYTEWKKQAEQCVPKDWEMYFEGCGLNKSYKGAVWLLLPDGHEHYQSYYQFEESEFIKQFCWFMFFKEEKLPWACGETCRNHYELKNHYLLDRLPSNGIHSRILPFYVEHVDYRVVWLKNVKKKRTKKKFIPNP